MTVVARAALAAACLTAAGCVTTQAYPVCFFRERPAEPQLVSYEDATRGAVALYMGSDGRASFSWNRRLLVARGSRGGHRRLRRVWPQLGCVGSYIDDTQYVGYARCLRYVAGWLEAGGPEPIGEASDGGARGQLYCDGNGG